MKLEYKTKKEHNGLFTRLYVKNTWNDKWIKGVLFSNENDAIEYFEHDFDVDSHIPSCDICTGKRIPPIWYY